MFINFLSPKDNPVKGEFVGNAIRERELREVVHYREDDKDPFCSKCGCPAKVWLDSEYRWEQHPARCSLIVGLILHGGKT